MKIVSELQNLNGSSPRNQSLISYKFLDLSYNIHFFNLAVRPTRLSRESPETKFRRTIEVRVIQVS